MAFVTADPGVVHMEFFGSINKVLIADPVKIITGDIHESVKIIRKGKLTYFHQAMDIPEDYVVYYWLLVSRHSVFFRRIHLRFKVHENDNILVAYHY